MSFLVDTNVFSEGTKPRPDSRVQVWMAEHESELYVSALTLGEIRYGVEKLPSSKRKRRLQVWFQSICDIMEGRILSVNASVAHVWGQLRGGWVGAGLTMPARRRSARRHRQATRACHRHAQREGLRRLRRTHTEPILQRQRLSAHCVRAA